MSKLYVFGIGGTGSRVLKSLTMLLASGVKCGENTGIDTIVPIIIDPDTAAADLTRTDKLMRDYAKIRSKIDFNTANSNTFFNTKIDNTIVMPLQDVQDKKFKEYIGLDSMTTTNGHYNSNYALASILFSELNLKSDMSVGFKGNPNIGSVVLNQFPGIPQFSNFAASFNQGDRIFIISSIFGGTGASGFPLLLKNLRAMNTTMAGNANVKNAPIGAISVLPYFDVTPPDGNNKSEIDSSTFVSKTKAALTYYDKNITEANVLYYIADTKSKQYNNSEGGTTQQNDAHFVELAAALSILDFANMANTSLETANGVPQNPQYKEFGILNDANQIIFSDLDASVLGKIQKPLTQFVLFGKYMREQLTESSCTQTWAQDNEFDSAFFSSTFYQTDLTAFCNSLFDWYAEMAGNTRAFAPFELSENKQAVFSLVKGMEARRLVTLASNYALFDARLNAETKNTKGKGEKEHRFMELFYRVTERLVKEKFNMQ